MADYVFSVAMDFVVGLDPTVFAEQVAASSIGPTMQSVIVSGTNNDVVTLAFDGSLSAGEQTALDAIVEAHGLALAKSNKVRDIGARTRELISDGFVVATKRFSLSTQAQIKIMSLYQSRASLTYPVRWNTFDDGGYHDIANAAQLEAAFNMAFSEIRTRLDSGTTLKSSVRSAETVAQVDSVEDNR